ncbi:MAG TPA: hypothetical protein PK640_15020 [Verrucomicrobiota bacterium]|nr:hypothetical protein [Verrucomicrobiota bacterium]
MLFIGNSFTIGSGGGGVPGIFDRLAQAGGQADPITVMRAVGGQNFQYHSQDATTQSTLESQPWTHVVLQNYSTEPTHLAGGSVDDHYAFGTALYRQAMANSPMTRVILFETWSRAAVHPMITGVSSPTSFASTAEFQAELRSNYQGLADVLNATHPTHPPVVVAPVGTAWERAGGLLPPSDPAFVPLFGSDNYHGNANGYYLAACVIYSTIYGVSPVGLSTHPLVSSLNLGLTVPGARLEESAWATVSSSSQAGLQSFLLDLGADATPTALGPEPNDPAWHWNNITEAIGTSPDGRLPNLATTANLSTDIGFEMLSRFNGADREGSATSSAFPANATRDSLFGNTELFNGLADVFPSFRFVHLNPARTYSFAFYASRVGVNDNRETGYEVTGLNSGFAALNAAKNSDATARAAGIIPDASGAITIRLGPTANNDSANHFTHLGALRMDAVPRQEPVVFTAHPASQKVFAGMPAQFTAAVAGTPPFFIQWLTNGAPLPGANHLTCIVPAVSTNMNGTVFAVTVSNLAFTATSSNAVLEVAPTAQNPAGEALFFDFGGANTTSCGPAPNDPLYAWNNVTTAVGASATGRLTNLVTGANGPTSVGLVILRRFNGANENGTLNWPLLPANATRDSLFGNTESFGGLANVFPSFKLVGLDPDARYDLTFYASRTGVSDNRETSYTVVGANAGQAMLDAANNVTNSARITGMIPSEEGGLVVSLAPSSRNNNANHFTYLGVLRMDVVPPPLAFRPPVIDSGRIRLEWAGAGQLEQAASVLGPWSAIADSGAPPHTEQILPGEDRFFRLTAPRSRR